MNDLLLLVKAITLVYRESLLGERDEGTDDLVRKVITAIKTPEVSIGITKDLEIINSLKATATQMISQPRDHVFQKNLLLQQLKVNCLSDESTYESFLAGIECEESIEETKQTILSLRGDLNTHFKHSKIEEV